MPAVIETAIVLLFLATLSVALQSRLKLPLELAMILISLFVSFLPRLPHVRISPDVVFLLFLPPILFAAAYFTSWRDFKANARPIALLAIGLVIFTSAAVAAVAKKMLPHFTWPMAFVLGALVSPPDASAASALTRKLRMPRRLVTILEGESLVNDATALVIYRFALAAGASGVFLLAPAVGKFFVLALGGVAVGFVVGRAGLWLLLKLDDVKAQTLMSLITAFAAYTVGESAGVSGVISTVMAGLGFGRLLPLRITPQTRIEAKAGWDLVLFIINGFVFTMIGLQLPIIMGQLTDYSWTKLLLYAAAVNATVILVRFAWVFPATYLPRLIPSVRRKDPAPPWQAIVVLGWMGMRGIVSLAAALALPDNFPERSLLIFLTYTVILVTLIIPPLTLPALMRFLKLPQGTEHSRESALARFQATKAVLDKVMATVDGKKYSEEHVEALRTRYERRLKTIEPNLTENSYSAVDFKDQQLRQLLQDVIGWERQSLEALRSGGKIHDEVFHELSYELDLEDLRLKTPRL